MSDIVQEDFEGKLYHCLECGTRWVPNGILGTIVGVEVTGADCPGCEKDAFAHDAVRADERAAIIGRSNEAYHRMIVGLGFNPDTMELRQMDTAGWDAAEKASAHPSMTHIRGRNVTVSYPRGKARIVRVHRIDETSNALAMDAQANAGQSRRGPMRTYLRMEVLVTPDIEK